LNTLVLTNLLEHKRLLVKNLEKPTVYYHRGLSSSKYSSLGHDDVLKIYRDCTMILDQYDILRQETIKLLQQSEEQTLWINNHFYLYENGIENESNAKLMPKLFELIQTLPNAINQNCIFGNCMLKCLQPAASSTTVAVAKEEYGLTNCRIRCHIGLQCVNNDEKLQAYISVNNKRLKIENNRMCAFNDSIKHQYVNNTGQKQILLTIDLWHPDLSETMRKHLTNIFHTNLSK